MCDEWETFIVSNERIFFLIMKAFVTTLIHFESFKFCHLRIACFIKHARQYSFMIIFLACNGKKNCWELIVQMYKTHSFDNIRECAPINATKQNNAFTFWATQGPKVTFFYKIGLHACFDQCIYKKILIFFTHFEYERGFYA